MTRQVLKIHEYHSVVPVAINFYFDYEQMAFWQRIKYAIKNLKK